MKEFVFKIITSNGSGTGFLVKGFDYIITSFQIIKGHKKVAVEDYLRHRQIGRVCFIHSVLDIAFLQIDSSTKNSKIVIDSAQKTHSNDKVSILGYPLGMNFTVGAGIISRPTQEINGKTYLQTDAPVNSGIIGGPIISPNGILLGVTAGKISDTDNMGFGVPYYKISTLIDNFDISKGDFQVKCPSCGEIILEKVEFCPKCGTNCKSIVFDDIHLTHLGSFVENVLNTLGLDPVLARFGKDQWQFHQGSAFIKIFVYKNDYLIASSKLNKLPKSNLNEIYQYLLEDHHFPYTLGILDNHIYLSYRVHLSDIYSLNPELIRENLINLALKADDLDNFFQETYGCEFAIEAKI